MFLGSADLHSFALGIISPLGCRYRNLKKFVYSIMQVFYSQRALNLNTDNEWFDIMVVNKKVLKRPIVVLCCVVFGGYALPIRSVSLLSS